MKKMSLISVMLVSALSVFAGMEVVNVGSFSASGTSALTEKFIAPDNGVIMGDALYLSATTNTTLTISKPSLSTKMEAAEAADTSLSVYVSSSNTLNGFTLTTDDSLIVGGVKTKISTLGAYTAATHYQAITVATAVTAADNETIYVVDATDDLTFPVVTSGQTALRNIFTGYRNMPVYLSLPAAGGAMVMGGTYSVLK